MSKLIHRRTTVTDINYHIAWSTKQRKRVLVPELAADVQVWCREAAQRHGFTIQAMEIGHRDHVRLLLTVPVSRVLQCLKGYTSKRAFE